MAIEKRKAELVWLISDKPLGGGVDTCGSFALTLLMTTETGKLRNLSHGSFGMANGSCYESGRNGNESVEYTYDGTYADLSVYCWVGDASWEVQLQWRDIHTLGLHDVEALSKTAKRIRSRLERLNSELGAASTPDETLRRYCHVLGVKRFVREGKGRNGAFGYDGSEWDFMQMDAGMYAVRKVVQGMQEQIAAHKQRNAA